MGLLNTGKTRPEPAHAAPKGRTTTIPNQIIKEPTVNPEPASDDLVDDWYTAHLDAAAKADNAEQQALPLEGECRKQRQAAEKALNEAARLRDLLAKEEQSAEQATLLAQGAEARAGEWRRFQKRQQTRADGHMEKIDAEVAKGSQHPRERRQQPPQHPLDGPNSVNVGPSLTQPIPHVHQNGAGRSEAPAFPDGAK